MGQKDNITRRRTILAGGGTLAFGGAVAYFASRSSSEESDYVPETFHTASGTTEFGVALEGRPIAGESDAPVDVYYWTDYLCPFCKKFETETLPKVGRNYVDEGEARLVVLPYPNIGEYSLPAALWSRCVWSTVAESNPASFWRWHGAAFDAQSESGKEWASEETFTRITERTEDVAVSDVTACRQERGDPIRAGIEDNVSVARSAQLRGTPGIVLYNREQDTAGRLVGAQPYENFAEALDRIREA
jgi:protein-disulfide isomerase